MVEPTLQPRQPVHLNLERAQLPLGSEEAEGVDLPPDNVVNPRHLVSSSLGDGTASALDSYLRSTRSRQGNRPPTAWARDTAAYVKPYAVPGSKYPTWPGRQVAAEMLKEKLDAAVRYRDVGLRRASQ